MGLKLRIDLKQAALKYAAATLSGGDLAKEGSEKRLAAAALAYARQVGMVPQPAGCPIRDRYCIEHGFVHGKEAEELRAGIERVLAGRDECEDTEVSADVVAVLFAALQDLVDHVDARDSLAWGESRKTKRRKVSR